MCATYSAAILGRCALIQFLSQLDCQLENAGFDAARVLARAPSTKPSRTGWQTHAQTEGVPDMLRVSDFTGSEYLFVGENYRYFNLLSHKDYQLNAL